MDSVLMRTNENTKKQDDTKKAAPEGAVAIHPQTADAGWSFLASLS